MAYNRKMRKFEGTCYIPGEQLAMMAKYYRGANLNLNLTLFEDDLSTLQETLDQACWCSKLDEVDRMKMGHMKGNEWRIAHEHCLEQGPDGRSPKVYPALPQKSKSTVGMVERGTSAVSLYDRERGVVRGGRYQRDDYSEPRSRRDDYYDRQSRRAEYSDPRNRRGYYSDPRTREDYDSRFRRDDYPGPPVYDAQIQNEERGRNMRRPSDQRFDMESDAAMTSVPEAPGEIRCAVCNVETCLVCKNHLYSTICQCRCPVANAGLCNRCNREPCEEEESEAQGTRGNKTDLSNMMLTMMMSSMFKQSQAPEPVCCCKPSRDNSDSSSSNSSDDKVHKVYLYDCEGTKKSKKSHKKSRKASSDSSSACDCCKCSRKPKKSSGSKWKSSKTRDEETSDSDPGPKGHSPKGKDSKDSNRKSKGGDSNAESDAKPKGSKDSNRKSKGGDSNSDSDAEGNGSKESNRKSKEGDSNSDSEAKPKGSKDSKSNRSENNMMSLKMKNEKTTSMKYKARVSKAQGSTDSKNVQFSNTEKISSEPKRTPSPQKSSVHTPGIQQNIPDPEPSNQTKNDDTEELGEESNATFHLREFIVCLPKIQSNLQSLMYKLNQMDLNNQLHYHPIDPTIRSAQFRLGGIPAGPNVPLISSPQIPLHNTSASLYHEHPQVHNLNQAQDSEISLGFSPGNLPDQSMLPTIPSVSSNLHTPLNLPTRYHSLVNFPNPEPIKTGAVGRKEVDKVPEFAEAAEKTQSTFKMSLNVEEAHTKGKNSGNGMPSPLTTRKPSDKILQFSKVSESSENGVASQPNTFPSSYNNNIEIIENGVISQPNTCPLSYNNNIEIIELPEIQSCNQSDIRSRRHGREVHKGAAAATTSSQYGGGTMFQSYNQESSARISSEQELTDYASFSDEKHFQLSPAPSAQQACNTRIKVVEQTLDEGERRGEAQQDDRIMPKCSRSNRQELTLNKTRSVLKASKRVTFKAKGRNPLSLEKLVQGCTVRRSRGHQGQIRSNVEEKADASRNNNTKRLDQGVGPGKFRRSKSDSSLDRSGKNSKKNLASPGRPKTPKTPIQRHEIRTVTLTPAGKPSKAIPLKKKRSTSPIQEKTRYTTAGWKNNLKPTTKDSAVLDTIGLRNIPSDRTADQSESIWKMSDAYVRKEVDSQSYIVSSVEVKTINNNGSSADILKMVQGIASNSLMNATNAASVPCQNAPMSSEGLDLLPLLPLSSTGPTGETRSENQSGGVVAKKRVSFDNEISQNTPAFLRKSRVQVEQLKRAHETIRSMIKNVNEVIAHIDSDSNFGIRSKARSEDKEMQSYFAHLDDDSKRQSHCEPHDVKTGPKTFEAQSPFDKQTQEVQKMFLSVDRVLNSVLTPSDLSSVTPEGNWPSENTSPSRAHRDYFILNSDSSSTAFTESLRRSLENDTSRSVPLATQPALSFQPGSSQRPRSTRTRPLKRRSWFPPPKK